MTEPEDPFFVAIDNETPYDPTQHPERWRKLLESTQPIPRMTRRYTIQHRDGQLNFWTPVSPGEVIARVLHRCHDIEGLPQAKEQHACMILNVTVSPFPSPYTGNPATLECLQAPGILLAWDRDGAPVDPAAAPVDVKDGWINAEASVPKLFEDVLVQTKDGQVCIGHVADTGIHGVRWADEKGMTIDVALWQPKPAARS